MVIIKDPIDSFWRSKKGSLVLQKQWFIAGGRRNVVPTNRRHSKQQIHRLSVNRVYNVWRSLSTLQKNLWITYSTTFTSIDKYGSIIVLGAFQWFCRYNFRLSNYESSLILVPPVNPVPSYTPIFSILQFGAAGPLRVVPAPPPIGSNKFFVWRKLNKNNAVSKPPKPLVSYRSFSNTDFPVFTIALPSELDFNYKRQWFAFDACDEFGRSPGLDFDSWVSITGP